MVLIGALLPLLLQAPGEDSAAAVRRIAAITDLAAQEYRLGVVDGRVVAAPEVEEARLFFSEARRTAGGLPSAAREAAVAQLDSLIVFVGQVQSPDSIDARVRRLSDRLAAGLGVALDERPAAPPSLARGADVYRAECAGCHGALGTGDGPLAAALDPRPPDLTDATALGDQSLLDFYRRITIGVIGTAMPPFEGRLSADDRWAVALYASTLHQPSATPVLARVRAQLDSAYTLARQGSPSAGPRALDAYMTFEEVERSLRAKQPALATELEAAFGAFRETPGLAAARRRVIAGLDRAERALSERMSSGGLFAQSFVIMLREGLEAILVVGALLTFLVKMGAADRRRDVHLGIGAAIVASLLTAVGLETVFRLSPAKQEALEGITMVAATVVLFYVSYWLLSKMEVAKWNHFVKSKVHEALTSGSSFALASAAFLAVYREGFETVLFYKALFLAGGDGGGTVPVVVGMLAGGAVMVAVYVAIHRFGVRLPLRPFFGVTSGFLYYMAFVFAGKGIAELQEGEVISATLLPGGPRVPALGIYPTVESLVVQGVLLGLLLVALAWTFGVAPRIRRGAPAPFPPAGSPAPTGERPVGRRAVRERGGRSPPEYTDRAEVPGPPFFDLPLFG